MIVVVKLGLAMICYLGQCHPALVGASTPTGHYPLLHRRTLAAGYGGDILVFASRGNTVYAVHRVWLLRPRERRAARLLGVASERVGVTNGCINVSPEVYDALVAAKATSIVIEP